MLDLEIPVLETPRLRLRRPESRDFEAYAALCADPEVM
jgi:RimJ/RimL family protein N-acetyltransferase